MNSITLTDIQKALIHCVLKTEECLSFCIKNVDHKECVICARRCRDCTEVCNLMMRLYARKSELFYRMIPLGIETCKECLMACDRFKDPVSQECSQACADCITALRFARNL